MKNLFKVFGIIALVAVIGFATFAPAKIYAQQSASVKNTTYLIQPQDSLAKGFRGTLRKDFGYVSLMVYEFGESNFTTYGISWGLFDDAIQSLASSDIKHNVPRKLGGGTYKQSGNTIVLTNSDRSKQTYNINADGILIGLEREVGEVGIKVPGLNVNEWNVDKWSLYKMRWFW